MSTYLIFLRGGIFPGRLVTNTREGAARSLRANSPFMVASETSRAPLTCRPCVTSRDITQMEACSKVTFREEKHWIRT